MKKTILTLSAIFVIIICAGIYKKDLLTAYISNLKTNNFKPGDRIYAQPIFLNISATQQIFKLGKNADNDYIPMLPGIEISSDSLVKHKTNYLGVYTGYKLAEFKVHDQATGKDSSGVMILYQIVPNAKGVRKSVADANGKEGYFFTDNAYYIFANSANIKN